MDVFETADKISSMEIRGAGDIARATARAIKHTASQSEAGSIQEFRKEIDEASEILLNSRPTAVSLPNSIRLVTKDLKRYKEVREAKSMIRERADRFITRSKKAIETLGEIGSKRIQDGDTVLTHCNSDAALSVILEAHKHKDLQVIATESRPRLQGKITARELADKGVPVTMIVDSAVRSFMKNVDMVVVGADAIGVNGAVANKIGTSQIALAANEARVNFMVAAETYKFSPKTVVGEPIKIEERSEEEVWKGCPDGICIKNPAFDFTPPEHITLICTEIGLISPHMSYSILKEEFDWSIEELKN
ncbi:ribose 1,5-bisphosphate isomerase [Methanonatronarchaeum sp. AMET6-2]|uniref:ribose 1,5-bisphosphate isomerase n=1 Tax=Methanonatronarchaeum sp. AMET6-2 TaxID=2933293 RepID=UPI00120F5A85|nr:ribose 1,5-bisphosphate isomerase [Methanonatronarchaeum sp. AMET6-2]RZN63237.1 MAG: ribose 1,5-bisphosphate isomerase [Methanonatronarchaeia archaeon]UOY10502.1 ribose 1,5-bisphosphate isomerase [Methanonatronarchaeum sp. AMET6-2]